MSEWIDIDDELPEANELVLVYQEMTGRCLRRRIDDEWYDEHENYDDSELEILYWSPILKEPE